MNSLFMLFMPSTVNLRLATGKAGIFIAGTPKGIGRIFS
jgi:hypothetical protein